MVEAVMLIFIQVDDRKRFEMKCIKRGIKRDRVDYVYDLLMSKLKTNEIADKYCIAIDTVYQDRYKFRKILK